MSYSIDISEDRSYIVITLKGAFESHQAMEFADISHELAKTTGIQSLLVDLYECRNIQSEQENYDMINKDFDGNPSVDRRTKIALYVHPDDHSHDFTQSVAQSDGHNIRIFRDRAEAITFLKS
jgi:hypothetical protein